MSYQAEEDGGRDKRKTTGKKEHLESDKNMVQENLPEIYKEDSS